MRKIGIAVFVVFAGCGSASESGADLAMSISDDLSAADLAMSSDLSTSGDLLAIVDLASAADLASPDGQSLGDVGAPCTDGSQCATGQCISEAMHAKYVGGYCSVIGCNSTSCPSGSICSGGGAIANSGCFEECALGSACRAGYKCCPPQGADLGAMGICVPTTGTALSC
jgi:hypothetical protein